MPLLFLDLVVTNFFISIVTCLLSSLGLPFGLEEAALPFRAADGMLIGLRHSD
jgi:hypothetical protein